PRVEAQWSVQDRWLEGRAETHIEGVVRDGGDRELASRTLQLGASASPGSSWYCGAEAVWHMTSLTGVEDRRIAVHAGRSSGGASTERELPKWSTPPLTRRSSSGTNIRWDGRRREIRAAWSCGWCEPKITPAWPTSWCRWMERRCASRTRTARRASTGSPRGCTSSGWMSARSRRT